MTLVKLPQRVHKRYQKKWKKKAQKNGSNLTATRGNKQTTLERTLSQSEKLGKTILLRGSLPVGLIIALPKPIFSLLVATMSKGQKNSSATTPVWCHFKQSQNHLWIKSLSFYNANQIAWLIWQERQLPKLTPNLAPRRAVPKFGIEFDTRVEMVFPFLRPNFSFDMLFGKG